MLDSKPVGVSASQISVNSILISSHQLNMDPNKFSLPWYNDVGRRLVLRLAYN